MRLIWLWSSQGSTTDQGVLKLITLTSHLPPRAWIFQKLLTPRALLLHIQYQHWLIVDCTWGVFLKDFLMDSDKWPWWQFCSWLNWTDIWKDTCTYKKQCCYNICQAWLRRPCNSPTICPNLQTCMEAGRVSRTRFQKDLSIYRYTFAQA